MTDTTRSDVSERRRADRPPLSRNAFPSPGAECVRAPI